MIYVQTRAGKAAKEVASWVNQGVPGVHGKISKLIESRKLTFGKINLKVLAYELMGENAPNEAKRLQEAGHRLKDDSAKAEWDRFGDAGGYVPLREAGIPVGTSAFGNITGQLVFSEIRDAFVEETNIFTPRVRTVESEFADAETVPGIQRIGDQGTLVAEGGQYNTVGFGEEFFTWPAKDKRGLIVDVTEEAIFFDRTNLVAERAREVGRALGISMENQNINTFIGGVNNYVRNGVGVNTYQTATPFINAVTGVTLNDWRDIERLELLFDDIVDPNTGEVIELRSDDMQLVVTTFKRHTAQQILRATNLRSDSNDAAATRSELRDSPNTIASYDLVTSRRLKQRLRASLASGGLNLTEAQAREFHWLVNMMEAFVWLENWPLRTFSQGADGPMAFDADIVMRHKASYRGAAAVREPRWATRGRNT